MDSEPQQVPLRKRPKGLAFLFGITGLLLLNGGADSLTHNRAGPAGWIWLVLGVGFLVLTLWWVAGRGGGERKG